MLGMTSVVILDKNIGSPQANDIDTILPKNNSTLKATEHSEYTLMPSILACDRFCRNHTKPVSG